MPYQEENPRAFVLEPYFILLFAPFVIVVAYEFQPHLEVWQVLGRNFSDTSRSRSLY